MYQILALVQVPFLFPTKKLYTKNLPDAEMERIPILL